MDNKMYEMYKWFTNQVIIRLFVYSRITFDLYITCYMNVHTYYDTLHVLTNVTIGHFTK